MDGEISHRNFAKIALFSRVVIYIYICIMHVHSLWLCLTVYGPMDCSPSCSSVHGDSPGKNTGVGFHALLITVSRVERKKVLTISSVQITFDH